MVDILIHLVGLPLEIFQRILSLFLNDFHLYFLHFCLEVLSHQNIASHPRMAQYFRNGQSVSGVKCEHRIKEIFELRRKLRLFLMRRPKLIDVVECNKFVEAVVGGGRSKGRLGCDQIEESDSGCKEVIHHSVVIFSHQQLWRFERVRPTDRLGLAVIGDLGRKS